MSLRYQPNVGMLRGLIKKYEEQHASADSITRELQ